VENQQSLQTPVDNTADNAPSISPQGPSSPIGGGTVIQPSSTIGQELQAQAPSSAQSNIVVSPDTPQMQSQQQAETNQPQQYKAIDSAPMGMSASQLGLNTPKTGIEWSRFIKKALIAIVAIIVLGGGLFYLKNSTNKLSPLSHYAVSQSSPSFTVNFYKNAQVVQKNGLTYLISKDSEGKQTAIWIQTLSSPTSCPGLARFSFTFDNQSTSGCYNSAKDIYAALVGLNGSMYQISLTSQKPVSVADASAIYSSFVIQ
jgi:hypothetical protein